LTTTPHEPHSRAPTTTPRPSLDHDRHERWTRASMAVVTHDIVGQFIVLPIQGIGRLDVRLIYNDAVILRDPEAVDPSGLLDQQITLSYLWVLGAYEIIRTLSARPDLTRADKDNDVALKVSQTKAQFSRLRVPLAKFEPQNKHRATDSPVAYPGLHSELGVAWHLSPTHWITRRELSDALLEMLELIRAVRVSSFPSEASTETT
jgi:hypothetical protein